MGDWEVIDEPIRHDIGQSQTARTLRKTEDLEACMQTMMASQCTLIERFKELSGKIDALGRMIHDLKSKPRKTKEKSCQSTSRKSLPRPKN